MSILKVARMGHPVLRRVAEPVPPSEITGPEIQRLIQDLLDTVDDCDGAGLAAPQVHVSRRVVVLQLDDSGMRVWINPELTPLTDERIHTMEGCLSVPGLRGLVGRPAAVEVRALDENGDPVHLQLEGFPAVVAQHECDHLDGVLYVDKVEPRTLMFVEEYRRHVLAAEDELDELDEDDFGDEGGGYDAPLDESLTEDPGEAELLDEET